MQTGDSLGSIIDPFTDKAITVYALFPGETVGMAFSQPLLTGDAIFHLAWQAPVNKAQ